MTAKKHFFTASSPVEPNHIRVCIGGEKTVDYPHQSMVTQETLKNIYHKNSIMPQPVIDLYNQFTREINRATWHQDREFLLDQRHRMYVASMYELRNAQ